MTNSNVSNKSRANVTAAKPVSGAKPEPVTPVAVKKTAKRSSSAPTSASPAPSTTAAKPKPKLVRDSFTIPKPEYAVLDGLKLRAANLTRPVKKSELLRAGIAVLHSMNDKAFLAALNAVPSLKTGRPKGSAASSPTEPNKK